MVFEIAGVPTIYGVSGVLSEHSIIQPSPLYHTNKDDPEHLDYEVLHFYAEFMNNALAYLSNSELLPMDIFIPLERFESIISQYTKMDGNPYDLKPVLVKVKDLMKFKSSFKKLLVSVDQKREPEAVTRINKFMMTTVKGFNRTIGLTTRPNETYSVNYLYRLEMIEDYIHLANAIRSLRNIPITNFVEAARIESRSDNPYNWFSIHDSVANLESERTRIGKEIEEEITLLSEFLDNILTKIADLIDS